MSDDRATELSEEIDRAITDRLYGGVFTGLPGRVLAFDTAEQTATVQPEPVSYQGQAVGSFPALHDVPVMFPQGGGFRMTWPIKAGDRCWLAFACRSLDAWKAGDEAQPGGLRSHALSDAVAVPCGPRKISDPLASFNAADVELIEPTGGQVVLGSGPRLAVARDGDEADMTGGPGLTWAAWATLVNTALTALGAPVSVPSGNPPIAATSTKVEAG